MFSKPGVAALAVFSTLSACAAPDVSSQAAALQSSINDASEPLVTQLQSEVERDTQFARDQAIATRQPVYDRAFDCLEVAGGSLVTPISSCRLEPAFDVPNSVGTASYTLEAWNVVRAYSDAVVALADSKLSANIGPNLSLLLNASNSFAAAAEGQPDLTTIEAGTIEAVSSLAGRLGEASRARALRRLVNDAHEPLNFTLSQIIAQQDVNDQLETGARRVAEAYDRMEAARDNPAEDYGAAVAAYERQMQLFRTSLTRSQYGRVALIWRQHEQLRRALDIGQLDLSAAVSIAEDIHSLTNE